MVVGENQEFDLDTSMWYEGNALKLYLKNVENIWMGSGYYDLVGTCGEEIS